MIAELRRLVEAYPRYGSERAHQLLMGTGWRVNFKRVHRLWKQEHLQVPKKQHKRRRVPGRSENSCIRHRPTHRNHVWSYDFLMDRTEVTVERFARFLASLCACTLEIRNSRLEFFNVP